LKSGFAFALPFNPFPLTATQPDLTTSLHSVLPFRDQSAQPTKHLT